MNIQAYANRTLPSNITVKKHSNHTPIKPMVIKGGGTDATTLEISMLSFIKSDWWSRNPVDIAASSKDFRDQGMKVDISFVSRFAETYKAMHHKWVEEGTLKEEALQELDNVFKDELEKAASDFAKNVGRMFSYGGEKDRFDEYAFKNHIKQIAIDAKAYMMEHGSEGMEAFLAAKYHESSDLEHMSYEDIKKVVSVIDGLPPLHTLDADELDRLNNKWEQAKQNMKNLNVPQHIKDALLEGTEAVHQLYKDDVFFRQRTIEFEDNKWLLEEKIGQLRKELEDLMAYLQQLELSESTDRSVLLRILERRDGMQEQMSLLRNELQHVNKEQEKFNAAHEEATAAFFEDRSISAS
ncbi:hypothetical protein [Longirhabdus pacifica]|uniref:hypothetical protein n=1 Tax=Longirhabdus pacifica TaxID=2305227 RepID=UPI001008FE89|nr:hypothetical protein [Longirhabdus pacifica]